MTLPLTHRQQAKFAIESELIAQGVNKTETMADGIIDALERMGFMLTLAGAPRKLGWAEKAKLEKQINERRKSNFNSANDEEIER